MRKVLLMVLLAVVSNSAVAEWAFVSGNRGVVTAYADLATIRKIGNKVKMWSMYDYSAVQEGADGKSFLSIKFQDEYDCKEEKIIGLASSFFSENMNRGEVVYSSYSPSNWRPVAPGSINESMFKVACTKR